MSEEITDLRSLLQQTIAERDALEMRLIQLRTSLINIMGYANKTQLGDCCVEKSCHSHFADGEHVSNCAFQYGVTYGYAILAAEAEEALAKDKP